MNAPRPEGDVPAAESRAVDRTIEIAAPVDVVWNALTDPTELARWFPRIASVTPGVGGSLSRRWDATYEVRERIRVWEIGRHLQTEGLTGVWTGIVTDYWLEGRGGTTRLRVVSSGFGMGEMWDDLVDAFGGGWDFELRGLRHYLERHRGVPRLVARVQGALPLDPEAAWDRLTSAGGWFGARGVGQHAPGDRFTGRLGGGPEISGTIQTSRRARQLVATVDDWNDALLRVEIRGAGSDDRSDVILWVSTYGVPEPEVAAIEQRWRGSLEPLAPSVR